MTTFISRPYAPPDQERTLDLLRRSRPEKRSGEFPTPADLYELLVQPAVQDDTRLWESPGGALVAFALVDPYNNLLFEIAPHVVSSDLDHEIVAWGISCLSRRAKQGRPSPTLDASCTDNDKGRMHWLERNGFMRELTQTLSLERDLTTTLALPSLPEGFRLRTLRVPDEVEAWIELHQAAHGTSFMNLEVRLSMMAHPYYDPELDLVIEAPDGRLAAYCVCTIDQDENERTGRLVGATDPIATHPDFQRRGLALALLLTSMQLLRTRNMDYAQMSTTSTNLGMLAAASKAGFRIIARRYWYSLHTTGRLAPLR